MVLNPRTLNLSAALAALIAMPMLLAGCATTSKDKGGDIYHESAADVVNRAPSSMTIPADPKGSPVVDQMHLRTTADTHFTLAESYSLEGEVAKAIEEYKLTLVYDPDSPRVRLRLAAEYVKQGLISEAIDQCKAALEIEPKHQDARLLLGGLYSALRMYDDSIREYRQVVANDPTNTEAPLFIGAILAEQKKYPEACEGSGKPESPRGLLLSWSRAPRREQRQKQDEGRNGIQREFGGEARLSRIVVGARSTLRSDGS